MNSLFIRGWLVVHVKNAFRGTRWNRRPTLYSGHVLMNSRAVYRSFSFSWQNLCRHVRSFDPVNEPEVWRTPTRNGGHHLRIVSGIRTVVIFCLILTSFNNKYSASYFLIGGLNFATLHFYCC